MKWIVYMAAATYFTIAAIGGSAIAAGLAFAFSYAAGREHNR